MSHLPSYFINPSRSIPLSELPTIGTKASPFFPQSTLTPTYSSSYNPVRFTSIIRNPIIQKKITHIQQAPAYFLNSQIIKSQQQKSQAKQNFYVNNTQNLAKTAKQQSESSGCDSISMRGFCSVLGCLLGTLLAVSAILAIIYMSRQFLADQSPQDNIKSDQQFTISEQNKESQMNDDVIVDTRPAEQVQDGADDEKSENSLVDENKTETNEQIVENNEAKEGLIEEESSIIQDGTQEEENSNKQEDKSDATRNQIPTPSQIIQQQSEPAIVQEPLIQPPNPSTLPSILPTIHPTDATDPISVDNISNQQTPPTASAIQNDSPQDNPIVLPQTNVSNDDQTANTVIVAPQIIQPIFNDVVDKNNSLGSVQEQVQTDSVDSGVGEVSQVADPIAVQPIQILN